MRRASRVHEVRLQSTFDDRRVENQAVPNTKRPENAIDVTQAEVGDSMSLNLGDLRLRHSGSPTQLALSPSEFDPRPTNHVGEVPVDGQVCSVAVHARGLSVGSHRAVYRSSLIAGTINPSNSLRDR